MLGGIRSVERRSVRRSGQKGFTLVELIVVIAVLGILAAVVVFSVSNVNSSASNSACKTDASEIRTAVAAYQAQNGASTTPDMTALVNGNYLQTASTYYTLTWPSGVMTLTGQGTCTGIAG